MEVGLPICLGTDRKTPAAIARLNGLVKVADLRGAVGEDRRALRVIDAGGHLQRHRKRDVSVTLSRRAEHPCLNAGGNVPNAACMVNIHVSLLMARRGEPRNIPDDAEAGRQLIVEREIVQIHVVLHLVVQQGAAFLVIGSNVVLVRAIGAKSHSYGEIVEPAFKTIASMVGLFLIRGIKTDNEWLLSVGCHAALAES